jgi:hypothetical protein
MTTTFLKRVLDSLSVFEARSLVALLSVYLLVAPGGASGGQGPDRTAAQPLSLMIDIVEGEGAINNIKAGTAREPIVEVQDENHKPVSGALVSFSLARHGLGNLFSNPVLRATTDSTGRVHVNPLDLSKHPGRLEIHVHASYQGRNASVTIQQTNVVTANAAASGAGATSATGASAGGVSAGAAATAVGVAAVPVVSGLSIAVIAIAGAVAVGATVGALAAAGTIGGGGKTATVSVGTPHF